MNLPQAWRAAPGSVRAGAAALGVVSLYHLGLALGAALLQPVLRHDVAAAHPAAADAVVQQMLHAATVLSLSVHLPLFLLTAVLAALLPTGHPLALRPATLSQLFGIAFAYASTPPFTALQPLIPLLIALQALVIVLLWLPATSRHHFTAHPRSRSSRRSAAVVGHPQQPPLGRN